MEGHRDRGQRKKDRHSERRAGVTPQGNPDGQERDE
jgi:hypothetical protein